MASHLGLVPFLALMYSAKFSSIDTQGEKSDLSESSTMMSLPSLPVLLRIQMCSQNDSTNLRTFSLNPEER